MTIVVVVGNRPQFIKYAPVYAAFLQANAPLFLIHSGQHNDDDMSGIFFRDLGLPDPDERYAVTSTTHAGMTAEILCNVENSLLAQKPDGVIVFGDTNTTLGAVLAASKLNIPIAHIEAGPRTGDKSTPEEQNRIVADHLSTFRFCPDQMSVEALEKEGITSGVVFSGDTMYDAYLRFSDLPVPRTDNLVSRLQLGSAPFSLLTVHRPVNVDTQASLQGLLALLQAWPEIVVWPIHPRTKAACLRFSLLEEFEKIDNLRIIPPVGYLDMVALLKACRIVVTDSGGVQKEAFFASKPCLTLDTTTPWPALESDGWICLEGNCNDLSVQATASLAKNLSAPMDAKSAIFGNGDAAMIIRDTLLNAGWCP